MILTLILVLSSGSLAFARGHLNDDVAYDMCNALWKGYPSLLDSCLSEFESDYLDPAVGEYCKQQWSGYSSLWKSCLHELKNLKIQNAYRQICKERWENYSSLWKSCLKEHSREYNGGGC